MQTRNSEKERELEKTWIHLSPEHSAVRRRKKRANSREQIVERKERKERKVEESRGEVVCEGRCVALEQESLSCAHHTQVHTTHTHTHAHTHTHTHTREPFIRVTGLWTGRHLVCCAYKRPDKYPCLRAWPDKYPCIQSNQHVILAKEQGMFIYKHTYRLHAKGNVLVSGFVQACSVCFRVSGYEQACSVCFRVSGYV